MTTGIKRSIPVNYIRNGGFETGNMSFWRVYGNLMSVTVQRTVRNTGVYACKITGNGFTCFLEHKDLIKINGREEIVLSTRMLGGINQSFRYWVIFYDAHENIVEWKYSPIMTLTDDWVPYTHTFIPHINATAIRINIEFINLMHVVYIDDGSLYFREDLFTADEESAVKRFYVERTAHLSSGAHEVIDINVPDGLLYSIKNISFGVYHPTNAGSGTHELSGYYRYDLQDLIFQVHSVHNHHLQLYTNDPSFSSAFRPNSIPAFGEQIRNIVIGGTQNMSIRYENRTNVTQTNPRRYTIYYTQKKSTYA